LRIFLNLPGSKQELLAMARIGYLQGIIVPELSGAWKRGGWASQRDQSSPSPNCHEK